VTKIELRSGDMQLKAHITSIDW